MTAAKKPAAPAPPKMYVKWDGYTEADLVPGNTIKLSYTIGKMIAGRLGIPSEGTEDFLLSSVQDSPLKHAKDVRGSMPRINLRLEGGLSLTSRLGWMFVQRLN